MKKFFHSISTMMLLVALTGMGLASCSESPEAPEDPTENPDDEDKGDGSEGEGGDENKTVELNTPSPRPPTGATITWKTERPT